MLISHTHGCGSEHCMDDDGIRLPHAEMRLAIASFSLRQQIIRTHTTLEQERFGGVDAAKRAPIRRPAAGESHDLMAQAQEIVRLALA